MKFNDRKIYLDKGLDFGLSRYLRDEPCPDTFFDLHISCIIIASFSFSIMVCYMTIFIHE
jgi:hypothetical protein